MARWVLAVAVAAVAAAGCGPITYVDQVTLRAASSVDAARAAQAETYAPYYWTRAILYLRMAREEAARADFQGANHFGELSQLAADKATTEAGLAKRDPSRMPIDAVGAHPAAHPAAAPARGLAPAKDAP